MKVVSLDAKQSEIEGNLPYGPTSRPTLRSIEFRTNITDGFKFVAVMITERLLPNEPSPMLSAWTLWGSLKPIESWAKGETNEEFLNALPNRLPVVSAPFAMRRAFRPGRSLHIYGTSSFSSAIDRLNDFWRDYFDEKAGRGYCTPGEIKAGYFAGRINVVLRETNRRTFGPSLEWSYGPGPCTAPPPIVIPPASITLGGPRRRITSIFPTNQ